MENKKNLKVKEKALRIYLHIDVFVIRVNFFKIQMITMTFNKISYNVQKELNIHVLDY